jgi:hypothetical protein
MGKFPDCLLEIDQNPLGKFRALILIPIKGFANVGQTGIDEPRLHPTYFARNFSIASKASADPISPRL